MPIRFGTCWSITSSRLILVDWARNKQAACHESGRDQASNGRPSKKEIDYVTLSALHIVYEAKVAVFSFIIISETAINKKTANVSQLRRLSWHGTAFRDFYVLAKFAISKISKTYFVNAIQKSNFGAKHACHKGGGGAPTLATPWKEENKNKRHEATTTRHQLPGGDGETRKERASQPEIKRRSCVCCVGGAAALGVATAENDDRSYTWPPRQLVDWSPLTQCSSLSKKITFHCQQSKKKYTY